LQWKAFGLKNAVFVVLKKRPTEALFGAYKNAFLGQILERKAGLGTCFCFKFQVVELFELIIGLIFHAV